MILTVKKNFLWFLLLSVPLALIVGNRGDTNDTFTYYSIFKNINYYNLTNFSDFYLETGVELGWGLYSKFISFFSNSAVVLFSVFSLLTFYFIYKTCDIIKLKFIYVMCFYLPTSFFLMQQFMQIRQGFAVPVAVYASFLYLNNRKFISILFFILAFLFHQTIIVYILFFLAFLFVYEKIFKQVKILNFKIYMLSVLLLGIIFARIIVMPLALSFFDRLQAYSSTGYSESVSLVGLANIKFYLEFIFILFFMHKKDLNDKFLILMIFVFTIGLAIRIAFFDFAILSGRLSNVFLFIEIFLMPYFIYKRFSKIVLLTTLVLYFLIIGFISWNFQVAEYLADSYFYPLY
ncbi:EpsG family protein [Acinetobacter nosocomialis]|uniref:EpsG family protein n=1 Tax=Acinetobacter nosocomialis TaxID=106654 RepID=UPI001B81C4C1|nr:EpsG family protein [Acinetobacter nosocomialis]MBR7714724.1 EpsG family protein [Acinetobacter nosocomialis]MDF0627186.1 EpsG family protein [Acinetobacter nosocomialis]